MGNYEQLKKAVADVIKTNGNQEITGDLLQDTLLTIVSQIGDNATFAGVANLSTNPGTPDQNVFWIASYSGTYPNFNALDVNDTICIFTNKNGGWEKIDTRIPSDGKIKKIGDWLDLLGNSNLYVSVKNANIDTETKTFNCDEIYVFRYNKYGKKSSYKLEQCNTTFKGDSEYYEFLIYTKDNGLEFVYSSDEKILTNKADVLGAIFFYTTKESTNSEKKYDIFFSGDYKLNKIANVVYNDIQGIFGLKFSDLSELVEFENGSISSNGEETTTNKRIRTKGGFKVNPNNVYYFPRSDKFVVSYHEYLDENYTLHKSTSAWTTDKYYKPTYQYMRFVVAKIDSSNISVDDVLALDLSVMQVIQISTMQVLNESRSHFNYRNGAYPLIFGFGTFSSSGEVIMPYDRTRLVNANMINVEIGSEMEINIPSGYEYSYVSYNSDREKFLDRGWNTENKVACNHPFYNFVIRKPGNPILTFDDIKKINEEFSVTGKYNDVSVIENTSYPWFAYSYINQKHYIVELIFDIGAYTRQPSIQSLTIDKSSKTIYTLNSNTDLLLIDGYNKKIISHQLKPSTEHSNDCCIINNIIYVNGSTALGSESESKVLYKYNINSREAEKLPVVGINNGTVGMRTIGGICVADPENNNDYLYLVTQDYEGQNINSPEAKMTFYKYNIANGNIEELFNLPWDGWFIQGATCINGYIYVAGNPQPGDLAPNYKGVFIYIIDIRNKNIVDKIYIDGNFEPEGLDYIIDNGSVNLLLGIAHHSGMAKVCKMKI